MSAEECEKMDLEVNSLIDFSSENDSLIVNSSSPLPSWGLEEYPSSGATNIQEEMDMAGKGNRDDQFPQLHESKEPGKARKGKVNLRKSLAWDSAFFTDAGVLDAEELSSIIKGGEKHNLPMIEEDVRQSDDSISTLESDNLTLDHIEAELFGDIRASIQNLTISSSGDVSTKTDSGANSSVKKVDLASKDRMKPKLAPKRIIGAQAGIPKSQPKQITGTQRLGGLKQDKTQVTQPITRPTDGASLKPPKISTKSQPVSAGVSKRASLDISRVKIDNNSTKTSTASVRGAQTPKASASNNASRVLPRPAMSMKAPSVGSSAAMRIPSTRSSSDSSGSTSSDKTAKSSLPAARRKVDSSKPTAQPSASAKLRTPSKAALKSKVPSGNSAVSAYLMSTKINSSISPASSISEWSSASSSSSAAMNQRSSNLRISLDTSSCRSFDSDTSTLDLKNHLSDQTSNKPEIVGTPSTRGSLKQAGTISRPASMKPTGLRMPSPKMGYFDGVKAVHTPNGSHPSLSTVLPKTEVTVCSPNGNSNMKAKSVKVPLRANRKPESLKHLSPVSSSDKSNVSVNHSTALPKTVATICSPKGNSNTKAKSVKVPLRANRRPENLKHLSPVSSTDKSNVSDNHPGAPSDITLIPELSLEVHHEISGANTLKNMDVVAEEADPFENIRSAGLVVSESENQGAVGNDAGASLVATKSENQGVASNDTGASLVATKSENKGVAGNDAGASLVATKSENQGVASNDTGASLVATKSENQGVVGNDTCASLVAIKSENQGIASTLNNKEVLAEGPDTVEHAAADGLVGIKSENHVIVSNDTVVIESGNQRASTLNNEEVVPERPDTFEHVAGDDLVEIKGENQVIANNDMDVIKSENQRLANSSNDKEVAAEGPDSVEHVPGDGLVAIKSEDQVMANNDVDVIKSENQRLANSSKDKEVVTEGPDSAKHVADDGLVAVKSESLSVLNSDMIAGFIATKGENQGPDSVEHVPSDGLVVITGESQSVLNSDMVAGLIATKGENVRVMENEMNWDTTGNTDIKTAEVVSDKKDSSTENNRRCETVDGDGVGVQCNLNYNSDVLIQKNEMNLEDSLNGDFKNTKIDQVEDSTIKGAEIMPSCQTGDEDRVDVKDDLNTLEKTNTKKNVYQLNSQAAEVSTTPFSDKVESLMNKLAYLSLHTPDAAARMPFAIKNSSTDFLDFSEEAVQVVGKTDLDLPSLEIDHKENNNL
ncbi:uncharacterized protein [Nicotiana sylvestris]|uniref:Chitinase-like protein PB1E7.04c isoform X1 n=1 Tax=Nicotiana sylvestris TaxID=4096 RepID=A0A1U7Y3D9_NICSY|nr:PREDICTED: chitinase-like protein PB1E7.04c isoform X1 [Nicotiana sylvestris]